MTPPPRYGVPGGADRAPGQGAAGSWGGAGGDHHLLLSSWARPFLAQRFVPESLAPHLFAHRPKLQQALLGLCLGVGGWSPTRSSAGPPDLPKGEWVGGGSAHRPSFHCCPSARSQVGRGCQPRPPACFPCQRWPLPPTFCARPLCAGKAPHSGLSPSLWTQCGVGALWSKEILGDELRFTPPPVQL